MPLAVKSTKNEQENNGKTTAPPSSITGYSYPPENPPQNLMMRYTVIECFWNTSAPPHGCEIKR